MKQVLAVRVGAKKAVGHIVSKKWGPTVGGLGSEARFQVKKSACFWCHGILARAKAHPSCFHPSNSF